MQSDCTDKKYQAGLLVTNAIKRGNLVRPAHCSNCGRGCTPHGHHADYDKPLEVEWLCHQCHLARHGLKGETHHLAKLTWKQVRAIRRRAVDGVRFSRLAEDYGVSPQTIRQIVRNLTWREE